MAEKKAIELRVGDRLPGPFGGVVEHVERDEQFVRVWVEAFVPKCYEPHELVDCDRAEQKSEAQR